MKITLRTLFFLSSLGFSAHVGAQPSAAQPNAAQSGTVPSYAAAIAATQATPSVAQANVQQPTSYQGGVYPIGGGGIPAGFVLVQANYIDQIARASEVAINSARDNVDILKTIVLWGGSVFALIGSALAFFGFNSFKKIRGIGQKLEDIKNKETEINSRMTAIDKAEKKLIEKIGNIDDTLKTMGTFAVQMGTASFKFSGFRATLDPVKKTEYADQIIPEVESVLEVAQKLSQERAVSWARATLGVLHLHKGDLEQAYKFAKASAEENPNNWDDRYYNVACICARLFAEKEDVRWKNEALESLRKSLTEAMAALAEKDEDFSNLRHEVSEIIAQWNATRKAES